jgi:hypothetical protein
MPWHEMILDFGLGILDLRYSVNFIKRQRQAIPAIENPKLSLKSYQWLPDPVSTTISVYILKSHHVCVGFEH